MWVSRSFNNFLVLHFFVQLFFLWLPHEISTYANDNFVADNIWMRCLQAINPIRTTDLISSLSVFLFVGIQHNICVNHNFLHSNRIFAHNLNQLMLVGNKRCRQICLLKFAQSIGFLNIASMSHISYLCEKESWIAYATLG